MHFTAFKSTKEPRDFQELHQLLTVRGRTCLGSFTSREVKTGPLASRPLRPWREERKLGKIWVGSSGRDWERFPPLQITAPRLPREPELLQWWTVHGREVALRRPLLVKRLKTHILKFCQRGNMGQVFFERWGCRPVNCFICDRWTIVSQLPETLKAI
jgi:hypothetical protein